MEFLFTLLVLVLAVFVASFILLVLGTIQFEISNTEIPPGMDQPIKLRIIHGFLVGSAVLGKILERMGLCSQLNFVRCIRYGKKPGMDPKLFVKDLNFETVPVRVYQPRASSSGQRRGIVFFHGGGWVFGDLDSHEKLCRYIARESESVVASVEYRLAPEHKYPAQFDDCLTAAIHFMRNTEDYGVDPTRIIIAGDSAGGHLAALVSQAVVSRPGLPKPRAQVLIYPFVQGLDFNLPSYLQNCKVPLLFRERVPFFALLCLNGDVSVLEDVLEGTHIPTDIKLKYKKWLSLDNIPEEFKVRGYKPQLFIECKKEVYEQVKEICEPTFSPLLAEDAIFCQLPESFILTCEYDVLRDDGLLYKKRLEDSGVQVTWYHVEDGFHGVISMFDNGILSFPAGKKALDKIINFLRGL
ncbi:arylacetamide deacetylase-like 4 [Alligator mississippiensis]|uniref:arylacetamide deacetylase-like 4 n=1 Tax=Alligator mississippiensis TaxID=8496 RepID=UPI000711E7D1|nr:arylacetamide deacetylase-like 4 [Alligator mississippiensis]